MFSFGRFFKVCRERVGFYGLQAFGGLLSESRHNSRFPVILSGVGMFCGSFVLFGSGELSVLTVYTTE